MVWTCHLSTISSLVAMSTIPFDEIVPGATARLAVIETVQYLSVRDVLMHTCELSTIRANEKWRLLSDEVKNELAEFLVNFQFPGKGNKIEPVITFQGVLKLVMLVSGQKAALYRSAMVKILQKYYAGDSSLLEEVEANAQSAGPIQQMARASLVGEAVPVEDEEALSLPFKKRRMELELARMDADVHTIQIANRASEREHLTKIKDSYQELCEDKLMDERARVILKDSFLNMALLQAPMARIGDGAGPALIMDGAPISLSLVRDQLHLNQVTDDELISVGQRVSKDYEAQHGKRPSKHTQLLKGRATMVNTYCERDRPLLEAALRLYVAGKT